MRLTWLLVAGACATTCIAACTEDEVQVAFGTETVPLQTTYPVGAGLTVWVSVYHVTDSFGDEDPEADELPATAVTLSVSGGGTVVPCSRGVDVDGCVAVDGSASELTVEARTPDGTVTASRPIATDFGVAIATPDDFGVPESKLQALADASISVQLSFATGSGALVSGFVEGGYATTGPIALSDDTLTVTTGDPGDATVAAVGVAGAAPAAIRVVTQADSLASIARFTANRELDGGDTALTVYTDPRDGAPIDESDVFLDGLDADGFLALGDLPIVATGPYLAPTGLTGGPCVTIAYCFPHASLPDGVDETDTYLELAAGSADQRIPVHVLRSSD